MSDLALFAVVIGACLCAAHIGYTVGRIRESNRWWPEVSQLRETVSRQALLLKLMPKEEVRP